MLIYKNTFVLNSVNKCKQKTLDFARNIGIIRRVQVSFPALGNPIKTGGLSTAFIECKQKCKQTFNLLLSMGKGEMC